MTTSTSDGSAGSGPPKIVRILDAVADAWWAARITFRAVWARWSQ